MCQSSVSDTEAPVVSSNDESGDLLVLEGTSDQDHQTRIQKRVGNALHDQSELEFLREVIWLEGKRVEPELFLDPGTPLCVVYVFSKLKESVLDCRGGDLDTRQPFDRRVAAV